MRLGSQAAAPAAPLEYQLSHNCFVSLTQDCISCTRWPADCFLLWFVQLSSCTLYLCASYN